MYFKQYSSNEATLKEWSRQLTIANKGNYMTYSTVESTLEHWKNILNMQTGTNIFDTYSTVESTIYNWQQNLNNIYNK